MTSLSRTLPRLAVAVLAIAVLAAGCRTKPQKPFHYSGVPGEGRVGPADALVKIGEDCQADPEKLVLETEALRRGSHDQVVWYVESGQPGDRVMISAKPAEEQDPADPDKGRKIRELFQLEYDIRSLDETPPNNAIPSGKPNKSLLILKQHYAIWKYNIEFTRAGKKLCTYDPTICIQKPGSDGCSMANYLLR